MIILPDSIISNIFSHFGYRYLRYLLKYIPNLTQYKIDLYDTIIYISKNNNYPSYSFTNFVIFNDHEKFNIKSLLVNINSKHHTSCNFLIDNIFYLKHIKKLYICGNVPISVINNKLQYLRDLTITCRHFDDIHLKYLDCLTTLKVMSISKITNNYLNKLTNLKHLHIMNCSNITDNGINILTNLQTFMGQYHSFSPECFCNHLQKLNKLLLSYNNNINHIKIINSQHLLAYLKYKHLNSIQIKYFQSLESFIINYTQIIQ
jgi:hypothetical protein